MRVRSGNATAFACLERHGSVQLNVDKTEVMVISKKTQVPRCGVRVNNNIKQVRRFCYLGSYITEDGRCIVEIKNEMLF